MTATTATNDGLTILLGEDDLEVRSYLEAALKCQGYSVETAADGDEVLSSLQSSPVPISAVILDAVLPRKDGLEALKEIRRFDKVTPVILIDGSASQRDVALAMRNGASDFLRKPVNPEALRRALTTALANKQPAAQKAIRPDRPVFFGTSPRMRELQEMIGLVGSSDAPVLILGETGVGKEVLARELHARSPRAKKSILKLNCAALPSELVESELFGYERGAFTGAFQKKLGMFELADGGTILLDEIGDMDVRLQAKLLQVLQDHEFQRLGGNDTIRVDVRVIAATHRDLRKAIAENTFREDLYYRLNVISLRVPALRERREDILTMAEFLIRKYSAPGATPPSVPPALATALLNHHWPGNVRELENTVRKFLILGDARTIEWDLAYQAGDASASAPPPAWPAREAAYGQIKAPAVPAVPNLPSIPGGSVPVLEQLATAKREADRAAILEALKSTNWNRRQASALLKIDYKALLYKMKGLAIKKEKPNHAPLLAKAAAAAVAASDSIN